MKHVLMPIATAIALIGFVSFAGCDADGTKDGGDSLTIDSGGIDVDSGVGGTEVSVDDADKDYTFEGTATGVSGDMVTITHGDIDGFKPAGSNSYKLADKEMAQYVENGELMEFTVKVVGDQAMITAMETAEGDAPDASPDAEDKDLDTIGSNSGK